MVSAHTLLQARHASMQAFIFSFMGAWSFLWGMWASSLKS